MNRAQKYWGGQSLAGLGLCILFVILAAIIGGSGYIAAAITCGVIGVISGIVFFTVK